MVQLLLVVKKKESIGKSRGGITTKIHAITDSLGQPLKIVLTGGNVHDSQPALELVEVCTSHALLADKAYGSSKILSALQEKNTIAVIPPKSNSRNPWEYDKHLYKERQTIECFFQKIKEYRRIATRYDKLQVMYKAFILIAANLIWMK